MTLIEIDPVVIEIRRIENDKLVVPVNNTLVCHTAFLAADTRPYVLIIIKHIHASNACITEFHIFISPGDE